MKMRTANLLEGNAGTNLAAQIPNLLAGRAYINFHTVQFTGGEIRGQILLVPGPIAGVGFLPLVFGGFMWLRRRKAGLDGVVT